MTPADRRVDAAEWSRITALVGLGPAASPADVIAALERRGGGKDADKAAREARAAAIRACRRCDLFGWRLGPDRSPVEPATRCIHAAPRMAPPVGRDVTEPLHEPPLEGEP